MRTYEPNTKKIEGKSGKEYFVRDTLDVQRFQEYEVLQTELAFGLSFAQLVESQKKIIQCLNDFNPAKPMQKTVEVQSIAYNNLKGVENIASRTNTALLLATLFIVEKDEGKWTKEGAQEKIEDWSDIDVGFFLNLALSSINNFSENYTSTLQFLEDNKHLDRSKA